MGSSFQFRIHLRPLADLNEVQVGSKRLSELFTARCREYLYFVLQWSNELAKVDLYRFSLLRYSWNLSVLCVRKRMIDIFKLAILEIKSQSEGIDFDSNLPCWSFHANLLFLFPHSASPQTKYILFLNIFQTADNWKIISISLVYIAIYSPKQEFFSLIQIFRLHCGSDVFYGLALEFVCWASWDFYEY